MRVRFKEPLSPVLLQYFGVSTIGGYGGVALKSGIFEAEEETTTTGGMWVFRKDSFGSPPKT